MTQRAAAEGLAHSYLKASYTKLKVSYTQQDYCFVSCDPKEQLLLGPAFAIAKILKKNGLTMQVAYTASLRACV